MKKCRNCLEIKNPTEFHTDKQSKDGHRNTCKCCISLLQKVKRGGVQAALVPQGYRANAAKRYNKIAQYGSDLVEVLEHKDDSISYDDAMHEIRGY
jgi:hypothetical protein